MERALPSRCVDRSSADTCERGEGPPQYQRRLHGFDFNEINDGDGDGVWFEGTGQMTVAYAFGGQPGQADLYRQELIRAQQTAPFGDTKGIVAASHDGLVTGFNFDYFGDSTSGHAWNVFAQLGFNPYYQRPRCSPMTLAARTA